MATNLLDNLNPAQRRAVEVKDGKLKRLALAGADKKWFWADAVIDGQTVVVSSPDVKVPVAVRYAWAENPICNLFNASDLPASPFRTDTQPGITQ